MVRGFGLQILHAALLDVQSEFHRLPSDFILIWLRVRGVLCGVFFFGFFLVTCFQKRSLERV